MHAQPISELDELSLPDLVSMASEQPVLDHAHEDLLIQRAGQGDPEAMEQLVLQNLRIAIDEAIRTRGLGMPQAQLVRTAVRTLLDAANSYDPTSHGRFSAHARGHVRRALQQSVGLSS